jgi:hypothetical protein
MATGYHVRGGQPLHPTYPPAIAVAVHRET